MSLSKNGIQSLIKMTYPFFSPCRSLYDPGFRQILALKFYDGPELGLAVFPSGEGVRFSVIGESSSQIFRAFNFSLLSGDWSVRILNTYADFCDKSSRIIWTTETGMKVEELEHDILNAIPMSFYIGVGTRNLDKISAIEVTEKESLDLQRMSGAEAFFAVHNAIKIRRKDIGRVD